MARITVEDCIKLVNNQYDLVILAKERAVQLGRGATPAVDPENDKKPVIALREIGESKITAEELKESIVSKLRQIPDYDCLLYTSPSPRDMSASRMPSSA